MLSGPSIMTNARSKSLAPLLLMAVLPACAAQDDRFPSLALRPFETASPGTPSPSPSGPLRPVADPATIAALRNRANTAHSAYLRSENSAERIARSAAGRSIETNARAAAFVAMADLASQRGATSAVLADVDLLAAAAATALAPDPALDAVQAEVAALVAREDAGIARLWAEMGL